MSLSWWNADLLVGTCDVRPLVALAPEEVILKIVIN